MKLDHNINGKFSLKDSLNRISSYLHSTPIVGSESLDNMLGHKFIFKAESLQKTGAFKVRGVLNHLLYLKEHNSLPEKIVAYSTGNHGIGVAYASKMLGVKARIYLPENTAKLKQQQCKYLGAEVIYTKTRIEAEQLSIQDSISKDFYYMHPSDSEITISGAGTVCFEALNQYANKVDAIFASCGGGGLLSGCYSAKEEFNKNIKLIGSEPEQANDAQRSLETGKIFSYNNSPDTIADGLRTLKLSERTFSYLKKLDDFITVSEYDIEYWTVWLIQMLKIMIEPSCAVAMASASKWLLKQSEKKTVLIILSGGNIDPNILSELLNKDYLLKEPKL
jgi:threo-3-hydroxy-L-aspartate ammonia-lyase